MARKKADPVNEHFAKYLGKRDDISVPPITCADGFQMSVQASYFHYCTPRANNRTDYTSVEVGFPSAKERALLKYMDGECEDATQTVYAYVPVAVVNRIIKRHGGVALAGAAMARASSEGWTPGPWNIAADIHDSRIGIGSAAGVIVFAPMTTSKNVLTGVQGVANARLIAAAPCLFSALSDLVEAVRKDSDEDGKGISGYTAARLTDARAALAKATGEQP